jgi:hypothetical protein
MSESFRNVLDCRIDDIAFCLVKVNSCFAVAHPKMPLSIFYNFFAQTLSGYRAALEPFLKMCISELFAIGLLILGAALFRYSGTQSVMRWIRPRLMTVPHMRIKR